MQFMLKHASFEKQICVCVQNSILGRELVNIDIGVLHENLLQFGI